MSDWLIGIALSCLLHLKLGLIKQFVKAIDKDGDCFSYIAKTFPGLSKEKLKAGIFDGPQIRKTMQNQTFTARMTVAERADWCSYVSVMREFLGNKKASSYRNLVDAPKLSSSWCKDEHQTSQSI